MSAVSKTLKEQEEKKRILFKELSANPQDDFGEWEFWCSLIVEAAHDRYDIDEEFIDKLPTLKQELVDKHYDLSQLSSESKDTMLSIVLNMIFTISTKLASLRGQQEDIKHKWLCHDEQQARNALDLFDSQLDLVEGQRCEYLCLLGQINQ
jgi:hypothetical protein